MGDVGRPTNYKEEYNDLAFKFCLLGATDIEMADFFDVHESTLNRWKLEYPEFCESIKRGKKKADAEIAHALYHRAKGYEHDDVHISSYLGEATITPIRKHYPPDTAAAFIWLKNRSGGKWKDCRETSVNIENADEYFKTIADALTQSDTNPGSVLPGPAQVHSESGRPAISEDTDRTA